jgi:hypothetical protein
VPECDTAETNWAVGVDIAITTATINIRLVTYFALAINSCLLVLNREP